MALSESPVWVLIAAVLVLLAAGALAALILWEVVRPRPRRRVKLGETVVELWVRERRFPVGAGAAIVPVAPDLKMSFGIAKWVRDATASRAQWAAGEAAPLQPGEAFVGPGGKYRFQVAALAVVMDETKRSAPDWIADGIARAMQLARGQGVDTCIIPDMTEDLLRHPQWITDEQRRSTCRPVAQAMLEGVRAAAPSMEAVRIWVWRSVYADIWTEEFDRLAAEARRSPDAAAPSAA